MAELGAEKTTLVEKDQQIRMWAIEQAIKIYVVERKTHIIKQAEEIYDFVKGELGG